MIWFGAEEVDFGGAVLGCLVGSVTVPHFHEEFATFGAGENVFGVFFMFIGS